MMKVQRTTFFLMEIPMVKVPNQTSHFVWHYPCRFDLIAGAALPWIVWFLWRMDLEAGNSPPCDPSDPFTKPFIRVITPFITNRGPTL